MFSILSILATLVIGGLGLYFKYFRGVSPAKQVAVTDHAMLKDAIDRPTDADVSNDLRDGKF